MSGALVISGAIRTYLAGSNIFGCGARMPPPDPYVMARAVDT